MEKEPTKGGAAKTSFAAPPFASCERVYAQ